MQTCKSLEKIEIKVILAKNGEDDEERAKNEAASSKKQNSSIAQREESKKYVMSIRNNLCNIHTRIRFMIAGTCPILDFCNSKNALV